MSPAVTVVICTRNRPVSLERCLESLGRVEYDSFHTLVVDNAPTDDGTRRLAERFGTNYLLVDGPGLSKARNAGLEAVSTDFVAWLDDDMVAHPGWLRSLMAEFADDKVAAATGPMLPLECAAAGDSDIWNVVSRRPWGGERFSLTRSSHAWFERTIFGGIGDGNFALRRPGLQWWKGFEESIGRGRPIAIGEEHLAFYQFVERGLTVAYAPGAIVFHQSHPANPTEHIAQDLAFAVFLALTRPRLAVRIVRYLLHASSGRRHDWRTWSETRLSEQTTAPIAGHALVSAVALLWRTWLKD